MMDELNPELKVLGQACIALVLGGIIGWERERAGKWAGFRTHMLVCAGAALFVRTGMFLITESNQQFGDDILRMDPIRIIEAIVTGVAFIGAGTVFRDPDRHTPEGLTTAASLLSVAPVGIAVALDRYVLAGGITFLVFFVLRVLGTLEHRTKMKS